MQTPQKHYENQLQICIRFSLVTPLLSMGAKEERENWVGVGGGMGGGGGWEGVIVFFSLASAPPLQD